MHAMTLQLPLAESLDWSSGAAYLDGAFMLVGDAKIPITDWGYRRSDVTYDVVSVWDGAFFRLDDHLKRFRASMKTLRLAPQENDADIRRILHHLVALTGLRSAYVAIDCLRASPKPGERRHPANARSYLAAFVIPYVFLMKPEIIERGAHMIIASTPRIPDVCLDARAKNFHWADMTAALFEADEKGADNPILLDLEGNVAEGPGYNVFCVTEGKVATPDRNVLEGISRLSAIDLCREMGLACELRKVPVAELREADEIFVTSTAGGIIPVTRLDSRILGNDRPGPVSERLREAYWQKRRDGWHAEPVDYASGRAC
jgi:branched-chain amino acid aminotransferase